MRKSENILQAIGQAYFILQKENKIKEALPKIIQLLGESCKVDRVYIFKNYKSEQGEKKLNYIFEWVADIVTPMINEPLLKELSWSLFPELYAQLSKNSVINDLVKNSGNLNFKEAMEAQEILAYLFIPIFSGNFFWGYIGFDNCHEEAVFSPSEVAALHALATTIGTTLQNNKQKRKIERERKNFFSVINSLNEVVVNLDTQGKILFLNKGWQKITGHSVTNSINKEFIQFFEKNSRERLKIALAQTQERNFSSSDLELELIRSDNNLKWVLIRLSNLETGNNHYNSIVVSITDIHEKKINEKETKKLTFLLQTINNSQLSFFEQDDFHGPLNTVMESLLKLTNSEFGFMGEVLYDEDGQPYLKSHTITNIAWSKETQEFYKANFEVGIEFRNLDTLFGHSLRTGEVVISNDCKNDPKSGGVPKGHPPLYRYLGIPVFKSDEFLGLIGIANKPTDYSLEEVWFLEPIISGYANFIKAIRINRRRKESEAMYKLLSENSGDIVALHDFDLKFKYVSPSIQKLLGYTAKEVIGKNPNDIFKEKPIRVEQYEGFEKMIIPHWHKSKTHKVILEILKKELKDEHGNPVGIIATSRDVTEREVVLEKLKKSLASEKDLNKLKSRFISMASHEFRTPLATIISSVELMSITVEKLKNEEVLTKIKTHLGRINIQTRRLTKIISDVLILEKNIQGAGPAKIEPVYISKLIYEIVEDYFHKNDERLIYLNLPQRDKLIHTDSSWLNYILRNIIENAVKYSNGTNKKPKLSLNFQHKYYMIEVEDFGIGIPKEDQKHIFGSFFRARNVSHIKGTGLGLNIVKEFVNKLGGKISFKSNEGEGTKFTIKLPYEK